MDDQAIFVKKGLGAQTKRESKKTKTGTERENQGHYVLKLTKLRKQFLKE
jgi:hypothetical protein